MHTPASARPKLAVYCSGLGLLLMAKGLMAAEPARLVAAATNAVIPYSAVEKLLRVADQVDATKLWAQVRITSAKTRPSDMHLTIQSAARAVPVTLGLSGEVLDFPRTAQLRREDPPILTDQPQNTIFVSLYNELPVPTTLSFPYAHLNEGLAEANKIIKRQAGILSPLVPSFNHVVFIFPKGSARKAKVEILSGRNSQQLIASTNCTVNLTLEKSLAKENPQVRLSEKPMHIYPAPE